MLTIKSSPVIFGKIFDVVATQVATALIALSKKRVVFIDTPPTAQLVELSRTLQSNGIEVLVRDHHRPMGTSPRDTEVLGLLTQIEAALGDKATFMTRKDAASCARLVSLGEFADENTVLYVDRDKDGFWSAMRGAGVDYAGLVEDADLLDGPRVKQTRANGLSEVGDLFARAMAALPQFAPQLADKSLQAWEHLCSRFLRVLEGDAEARTSLASDAAAYEAQVKEAKAIVSTATEVVPGIWLVDTTSAGRYDLTTLSGDLEAKNGCKVTVVRKKDGPIGKLHGVQISMAVVKAHQAEVNLQELLPSGYTSSPEAGIISNTSFLLHVSQGVWDSTVLPALTAKFGGQK